MYNIKNHKTKDIVIIPKHNENKNIKKLYKFDIKTNDKSCESISNGVEDYLIDGLSFKLPPGSSYITDRRKSTFWASGSNIYKSEGGTQVVRFLLNGEDGTWLDPSSIRIQFDLRNN